MKFGPRRHLNFAFERYRLTITSVLFIVSDINESSDRNIRRLGLLTEKCQS
jgi:hypothetical protein